MTADETDLIDTIIQQHGLTETNILDGLTEQQRKAWVNWAILGKSYSEIGAIVYGHRKNVTDSTVKYAIGEAQLKIVANILQDEALMGDDSVNHAKIKANLEQLLSRVQDLRTAATRKGRKP